MSKRRGAFSAPWLGALLLCLGALLLCLGALLLCLGALLLGLAPVQARAASAPYAPTLRGHVVRFALHGLEPDFDPNYGLVLTLRLHVARPAPIALPDATLVLDRYLESFQPDTTPLLPDLLHPTQTAVNLAGFLQGQAVLVNQGGHVAEQGDALAGVFADSTAHLVLLNLQPPGAHARAPTLRLQGVMTLYKGGTQTGRLVALGPLARAVPRLRGRAPAWQQVVAGLRVALPPMRGTAGGAPPAGTVTPSSNSVLAVATAAARRAPRQRGGSGPRRCPGAQRERVTAVAAPAPRPATLLQHVMNAVVECGDRSSAIRRSAPGHRRICAGSRYIESALTRPQPPFFQNPCGCRPQIQAHYRAAPAMMQQVRPHTTIYRWRYGRYGETPESRG